MTLKQNSVRLVYKMKHVGMVFIGRHVSQTFVWI